MAFNIFKSPYLNDPNINYQEKISRYLPGEVKVKKQSPISKSISDEIATENKTATNPNLEPQLGAIQKKHTWNSRFSALYNLQHLKHFKTYKLLYGSALASVVALATAYTIYRRVLAGRAKTNTTRSSKARSRSSVSATDVEKAEANLDKAQVKLNFDENKLKEFIAKAFLKQIGGGSRRRCRKPARRTKRHF